MNDCPHLRMARKVDDPNPRVYQCMDCSKLLVVIHKNGEVTLDEFTDEHKP
jgi:hypothetical protein